jgi:hypothetical protein
MKELERLIYHDKSLLSIAQIDNSNWADKIFFKNLLKIFFENKSNNEVILSARRPIEGFNTRQLIKETRGYANVIFESEGSYDEVLFSLTVAGSQLEKFLELCNRFWTSFEQPTLIASNNSKLLLEKGVKFLLTSHWKDLTKTSSAFVFFKGIEENVLWIGKSSALTFPAEIVTAVNFKAGLTPDRSSSQP